MAKPTLHCFTSSRDMYLAQLKAADSRSTALPQHLFTRIAQVCEDEVQHRVWRLMDNRLLIALF